MSNRPGPKFLIKMMPQTYLQITFDVKNVDVYVRRIRVCVCDHSKYYMIKQNQTSELLFFLFNELVSKTGYLTRI